MIRRVLNLTQEELADIMQVSTRTILRWEQNQSRPNAASRSTILVLAERARRKQETADDL